MSPTNISSTGAEAQDPDSSIIEGGDIHTAAQTDNGSSNNTGQSQHSGTDNSGSSPPAQSPPEVNSSTTTGENITFNLEQVMQLLNAKQQIDRSKVEKIKALTSLSRSDIESFLFEYSRRHKKDDKMVDFVDIEIYKWIMKQSLTRALDPNIDSHVMLLLRNFLSTLNESFQLASVATFEKELEWPSTGTAIEKIAKFMLQCSLIEDRIENNQDKFKRIKLNKAIFKVLPTDFGIRVDMADSERFATLTQIEQFLQNRHWVLDEQSTNKKTVKFNNVTLNEPSQKAEDMLSQSLAVLKENNRNDIGELKLQINQLMEINRGQQEAMYHYMNAAKTYHPYPVQQYVPHPSIPTLPPPNVATQSWTPTTQPSQSCLNLHHE